jgi:hypothetical protein
MMDMKHLPNVTAIIVDGRPQLDPGLVEDYRAIIGFAQAHFKFAAFRMLLHDGSAEFPSCETVRIDCIDDSIYNHRISYSNFILYHLHRYLESDFVLLMQQDGFILNPDAWDDAFLDYDYLGAPWPSDLSWVRPGCQVGNGGFSLRSRRLATLTSKLFYPAAQGAGINEDFAIGCVAREFLESRGIHYPSVETALRFSIELDSPGWQRPKRSFGFHAFETISKELAYGRIRGDRDSPS